MPGKPGASGSASSAELVLAGLWASFLAELAARAAHEINNALNGAMVNLEVVKARARAGVDGATIASFARDASSQVDETASLTGALLALTRVSPGTPDVGGIARDAVRLLAPAMQHRGVRLAYDGPKTCLVGGSPIAARLAVVATLIAACDGTADRTSMEEVAGVNPAGDRRPLVRCTTELVSGPSLLIIAPVRADLSRAVQAALANAAVQVTVTDNVWRLAFPTPPTT